MKRIFLAAMLPMIGLVSFAQGNSDDYRWKKDKDYNVYRNRHDDDDDDRHRDRNWRDRRHDNDRYDDRYSRNHGKGKHDQCNHGRFGRNNNGNYGQNSRNMPSRVSQAFYRDYPSAKDVSWRSPRNGFWAATFRSGLFNSQKTVTYNYNGQRVDNNFSNTGYYY